MVVTQACGSALTALSMGSWVPVGMMRAAISDDRWSPNSTRSQSSQARTDHGGPHLLPVFQVSACKNQLEKKTGSKRGLDPVLRSGAQLMQHDRCGQELNHI